MWVLSLGQEDPLEEEMATHSSILAWRILWTEEPGGLQSMGSQRLGHDRAAALCWHAQGAPISNTDLAASCSHLLISSLELSKFLK